MSNLPGDRLSAGGNMGNAWLLALALVLPTPDAKPTTAATDAIPVAIDERLATYPIQGDTASELSSQIKRLGPLDGNEGKRFAGNTRWSVRWNYMMAPQADGRCRLQQVQVSLEVTMTLPEWQPRHRADPLLKSHWPAYLAALTNHEMGHRANGVRAAFAVRDALAAVAPAASCQQLADGANAAANAAMNSRQGADVDYDRQTKHGALQGARLF